MILINWRIIVQKLLLIAVAGGLGALSRYSLAGFVQKAFGSGFPYGTMTVNITGCLIAGFLWALAENRLNLGGEARAFVFVGFMGAFTTFSTFILETGELMRNGEWMLAGVNMAVQNLVGVVMFFAGLAAGYAL